MSKQTPYWNRYWRQRHSRRRVLTGGAAATAGVAGLALVGCGDDDDDDSGNGSTSPTPGGNGEAPGASPTGSAGEPQPGGHIVYSQTSSTQTLDPHTSLTRAWMYTGFFSDKLVSSHHETIEPLRGELIESWEQASETELLLTVRSGANFHADKITNGRAFNAEDAAFNLMRIAGKLDPDRSALFARSTTLANLEVAEAIDESTVRVQLSAPNSQFMNGMGDWRNWIVAPENVEADPNFTDYGAQSGTGPFVISNWDSATETGTYIRNPDYWNGAAYLDEIRQVNLPDTAATQSAFLTGQIAFLRAQNEETRRALEGYDHQLDDWEHVGWEYLRMNHTREPFTDPQVRRAIFLAISPKDSMDFNYGEGYWDYSGTLISGFPGTWTSDEVSQMPGWNPDTKEEDIAEARRLMEAAGFPDGELSFGMRPQAGAGPWNQNGHLMKDQLEQVWPSMDITIVGDQDTAGWPRALATGDWDAVTYASFPPPSALLDGALHYRTGGGRNYTGFSNEDVDRLFDAALAELDEDARLGIVDEIQNLLLDEMVIATLGKSREVQARQTNLRGFREGWQPGPGSFAAYDPVFSARHLWLEEQA